MPDGMDVPAEIARREARLAAIRDAKAQIEARAAERLAAEQQVYEAKLAAREVRQKKTGKKFGGKPPRPPTGGVRESDHISLTDDESRIMKAAAGGFVQVYSAQALTEVDSKLIVGAFVARHPIAVRQIEPALAGLNELPEALGRPEHLLSDTEYCSKDNVRRCEAAGLTPLIAMKRDANHSSVLGRFAPDPAEPSGDDLMLRLHHRLATRDGKASYARRKTTSEPVFGVIRHVPGFRQFLLRGLTAVNVEWNLVSIALNLRRMHTTRLAK